MEQSSGGSNPPFRTIARFARAGAAGRLQALGRRAARSAFGHESPFPRIRISAPSLASLAITRRELDQRVNSRSTGDGPREAASDVRFPFSKHECTVVLYAHTILLCLFKNSIKLYHTMFTATTNKPLALPLEQLRDLYDRIPFVRGRARVALLHRLRRVSHEVRQARVARAKAPGPWSRAAGPSAPAVAAGGARDVQAVSDQSR